MWQTNICLVIWQIGDLVFVNTSTHRGIGMILRLCRRKNTEWYEVLIDGEVKPLMHYEFKPLNEVSDINQYALADETFYGGSNWQIDQTRLYRS